MDSNRGRKKMVAVAIAGVLVFVAAEVFAGPLDGLFRKTPAESAKAAGVVETPDAVKIPLASLGSGKALFLVSDANGRRVRYFALKSPEGRYRAALDACDVCFRANRGYSQNGDQMVCNNCGMKFPLPGCQSPNRLLT